MSAIEPGSKATLSDALIQRFILGELGDEERERVEAVVFCSELAFQRVAMEEDSLCADYVRDVLDGGTRARFELRLGVVPHLRERVVFHRALASAAAGSREVRRASAMGPASSDEPRGERAHARHRRARWTAAATLAAAALALAAYLGSGAGPSTPAAVRLVLLPSETRGTLPATGRAIAAPTGALSLELVLTTKERFARYRVVVRQRGQVAWSSVVTAAPAAEVIAASVPAGALGPGRYVLELSGMDATGREEAVASYQLNLAP